MLDHSAGAASVSRVVTPLDLPVLRRVRYFDGRLLTADDLTTEQEYHRERVRLHNRLLHGWGIVAGLDVRSRGGTIIVAPGMALDPRGEEIVLVAETELTAPPSATPKGSRFVVLFYTETLTDPVAVAHTGDTTTEYTRIQLGARCEVHETIPSPAGGGVTIARLIWRTSQWRVDKRFKRRRVTR